MQVAEVEELINLLVGLGVGSSPKEHHILEGEGRMPRKYNFCEFVVSATPPGRFSGLSSN